MSTRTTEDDYTSAIFYDTAVPTIGGTPDVLALAEAMRTGRPFAHRFTGTKADARRVARAMLAVGGVSVPPEYEREETGEMIDCPGEAHSNPFVDHCEVCAPLWGKVKALAPVDLAEARAGGFDVAVADLDDAQDQTMQALVAEGAVVLATKRLYRRGNLIGSYMVYRWRTAA